MISNIIERLVSSRAHPRNININIDLHRFVRVL
ncbi:MAG: hypothetical protein ACI8RD_001089 [Bacillariaceae sp.]|jgi:hypothetical protein